MSKKLDRIGMNEKRAETQLAAINEHLEQLRIRRKQIEDEEILRVIRGLKLGRDELPDFLDGIESGRFVISVEDEDVVSEADSEEEDADSYEDSDADDYLIAPEDEGADRDDLIISEAISDAYSSATFTDDYTEGSDLDA